MLNVNLGKTLDAAVKMKGKNLNDVQLILNLVSPQSFFAEINKDKKS